MATLTIADLDNGKRDLETVDAVANSQADSTLTRYGQHTLTLAGALRRLGWRPPLPYAPGLSITEATTTVERDGIVYRPDPTLVPFVTGAWDPGQWRVLQNTRFESLVYQFSSIGEAQAAAVSLPDGSAIIVEGISHGFVDAGAYTAVSGVPSDTVVEYADLDSYVGVNPNVYVAAPGIAGLWSIGVSDNAAVPNGGTIRRLVDGRIARRVYSGAINILWFGAKGDGVADDFAAIQSALLAANPVAVSNPFNYWSGGGSVFAPKGVYRITRGLQVPAYVTLQGEGRDGWGGGSPVVGVTSPSSIPNGTAFYADFANKSQVAISTLNYLKSTGQPQANTALTLLTIDDFGAGLRASYAQNIQLRDFAVFCTTATKVGIRLQGAGLSNMRSVSSFGFDVGFLSSSCWCYHHEDLFTISNQVGYAQIECNAGTAEGVFDLVEWGSSNGTTITNSTVVTAANKPNFWSANDTKYLGTSLYMKTCKALRFDNLTAQHCGRVAYAEDAGYSIGSAYIEDMPWLGSGETAGAFQGYNAASGNHSVTIDHLHCDSNGVTLFNNLANLPVTLHNLSGICGKMVGSVVPGNTEILLGENVQRNADFGDVGYSAKLIRSAPLRGLWYPNLTNISGTVGAATGYWEKNGRMVTFSVVVKGTNLKATQGPAIIETPFNGVGECGYPVDITALSVATLGGQVCGAALLETGSNIKPPSITATTGFVISGSYMCA